MFDDEDDELTLNFADLKLKSVHATVIDDELICAIDGKVVGSFKSEGFAHPTKRLLRLLVPNNAHVDDVNIWRQR